MPFSPTAAPSGATASDGPRGAEVSVEEYAALAAEELLDDEDEVVGRDARAALRLRLPQVDAVQRSPCTGARAQRYRHKPKAEFKVIE